MNVAEQVQLEVDVEETRQVGIEVGVGAKLALEVKENVEWT